MQPANCLNCGTPVIPNQNFCSTCGQKTQTHRLSIHDVGHDLLHYFTHADKGILSLLGYLATRPGMVSREYVEGKRRKYFPPINFFLIVAAIYVFMINIVDPVKRDSEITSQEKIRFEKIENSEQKAQVAAILERRLETRQFINKYSNIVAMIATPLISFFLWLFYLKGKYNYTEHLVANLYISGFTVLAHALFFRPLNSYIGGQGFSWVLMLYFIFEIIYRAISYYHFLNKRTTRSAVKALICSVAVICIWSVLVFASIYLYVSHAFWGLLK